MPCAPLTSNYTPSDCLTTAGVKSFYIIQFANMLTTTVVSNVVTAITKTASTTFKKYSQVVETATWNHTGDGSSANGTLAYDWEATMKTYGLDTLEQQELDLLLRSKVVLIAEMQDGNHWMLGRLYGSNAINDKFDAGTAMGDHIGNTISIKGRSNAKPIKVDNGIIEGLLV